MNNQTKKKFVLVHGAWHGGWCWSRVLPLLRAAGHVAHAVTLTGLGERAHLLNADIRLQTHIDDVLGLVDCEELDEVVLVGHSYAGLVVTGAADQLLQNGKVRIAHLIYVDAVTPYPGESWSSQHSAQVKAAREKAAADNGNVFIPPGDAGDFGLNGEDREWVNRRLTAQPYGVYHDPVQFDAERIGQVPRTFIDCVEPALPTIDVMRSRVRSDPGWRVLEMEAGHDPMVSHPRQLAQLLMS